MNIGEKCTTAAGFELVGAGYRVHTPRPHKRSFFQRWKGKPILSLLFLLMIVAGCICAPLLETHDAHAFYLRNVNQPPNPEFLFGTDTLGRDLYSMMWYGGRTSIVIGVLGAAIIAAIGTIYGCVSGTSGERMDSVLMRITEICGSIPSLLFVLILSAVLDATDVLRLSIVIGVTGWFGLSRIVRSEVRQIRNNEYVLYARCTGGSFLYAMGQHLIPNFVSAIMFCVISSISSCITTETTLSFLGLGLPVDVISWGSMLSLADKALVMKSWWVILFPGLFLVTTLMCMTNLGSYFRQEVNRKPSNL